MGKFYLFIWLKWSLYVTLFSILWAAILSLITTISIYLYKGAIDLDEQALSALVNMFNFWFVIFWTVTLLLALFRAMKYIFNSCNYGYKFSLLTCPKDGEIEIIEVVGYGDLVKVWRKWFMLIIWLVGSLMVISVVAMKLFTELNSIFDWFNIYVLYIFLIVSGYFSFIIMSSRCKRVKVSKC